MKIRELFNGISHLVGAILALIGIGILLVWNGDQMVNQVALLVYGLSLIGMFLASGIYHSLDGSPRRMAVLRKADHSAIYLLIAGTYTPFCVLAFSGFWQWGLLAIIVFGFGLLMVPRENDGPRRRLPGAAAKPRDAVAEWEQSMAAAGETPYQRDALQRRLNALKQAIGQLVEQDGTADIVLRARRGQRKASMLNRILPLRKKPSHFDDEESIGPFLDSLETLMEIQNDEYPDKRDAY